MERKINKIDPSRVKKGDLMALTYWTRVNQVNGLNELILDNLDEGTDQIRMVGRELIMSSRSADQYSETQKVSRSEIARTLIESTNCLFTVCFDKDDGTERVLRGRLVRPEALLGRSMVEDLDVAEKKNRIRLVDHRTLKWLIVDGVKYELK